MRALRLRPYALGADVIVVEALVILRMIMTNRSRDLRSQSEVEEPVAVEETGHAVPGSNRVALPLLPGLVGLVEAREELAAVRARAKERAKGRVQEAMRHPAALIAP